MRGPRSASSTWPGRQCVLRLRAAWCRAGEDIALAPAARVELCRGREPASAHAQAARPIEAAAVAAQSVLARIA